jgi:hypothetical protein
MTLALFTKAVCCNSRHSTLSVPMHQKLSILLLAVMLLAANAVSGGHRWTRGVPVENFIIGAAKRSFG